MSDTIKTIDTGASVESFEQDLQGIQLWRRLNVAHLAVFDVLSSSSEQAWQQVEQYCGKLAVLGIDPQNMFETMLTDELLDDRAAKHRSLMHGVNPDIPILVSYNKDQRPELPVLPQRNPNQLELDIYKP